MGLSIAVARTTSASGFGAFAVAFLLFGIGLATTRSAVGQPLQMRLSGASAVERQRGFQAGLGAATVFGVVFGILLLVVGLAMGGEVGSAMVALALVLPGLLLQDSCRMAAFTMGRPQLAALIDAVWAAVQFGLLAILINVGQHQVGALILAWGGAAAISALLGVVVLGARPAPVRTRGWIRRHRDLIRYLLPEYFLSLGATQFGILLVGVIASPSAVGSLRAAQVLLGPLGIIGAAVFQFAVPEVARRTSAATRWLIALAAALSGGLGLLTIGYVALLLLLPDAVGVALFGNSWAGATAVLLAMGLSSVSSALAERTSRGALWHGPGTSDVPDQPRQGTGAGTCRADQYLGRRCRGCRVGVGRGRGRCSAAVDHDSTADAESSRVAGSGRRRTHAGRNGRSCNSGNPGRKLTMKHHLVYRSYGGENRKRRPAYYSKLLTLTSFVRAASRLPQANITFFNDGPVPADRLTIMERFGRVTQLADEPQGLRASYRAALLLSTTEPWSDDDVVSYVEDDYLFTEGAFLALAEATSKLPQVSYFTMYGGPYRTTPTTAYLGTGRRCRT